MRRRLEPLPFGWFDWVVYALLALSAFFMITGCTIFGGYDPEKVDREARAEAAKTMIQALHIEMDGNHFYGIGLIKARPKYKVIVHPDLRITRLQWRTCHQEKTIDRPETGWFNNRAEFELHTQTGIEDNRACALEVIAMQGGSRVAFATVDFTDVRPEVALPFVTKCDGDALKSYFGVGICQASRGLVQRVEFETPVLQEGAKPECNSMRAVPGTNEKVYEFEMMPGKCTYYFVSNVKNKEGKRIIGRLNTIGYTDLYPLEGK